ncbi:anillin isoform X2 [Aplysia californica]|uniref:Anillin isoform X2 n=1 Tax=Aplysia californica TaxID=6500 RepID=A0ABM0JH58_APLCA|nr:anillin isoform X2 [Aplysia californica]
MDEDTQKLIERARQRREMLNQRTSGMPEAAPRKRRTPVLENDGSEKVLSEKQLNQDDSPKRQCLREEELQLKPDTPAVRGVQARAQDLQSENKIVNDSPVPIPRKSISTPPAERRVLSPAKTSPAKALDSTNLGSTRKNRFAALAQNINNWEDDMSHHVVHKEEEKKPRWQPPSAKKESMASEQKLPASSGKSRAPQPIMVQQKVASSAPSSGKPSAVGSPKKTHAPPTPRSPMKSTVASVSSPTSSAPGFARNSPLRGSKVEWNRSPKPFSPSYACQSNVSESKSEESLPINEKTNKVEWGHTPGKSASETAVLSKHAATTPSASISRTNPTDLPVNAPGLNETPPSDTDSINTQDEPTQKPVSQRFSSWEQKTATPMPAGRQEPSMRPLSAKLASFEKKITENTPKIGMTKSTHVPKTPKQVCTPALSASTPAASRSKNFDPSELPVSQRMSQMQEKLAHVTTPRSQRKDSEPTAFSVGARMSAWETMTSSNQVSDIKKVNPADATPKSKAKVAGTTATPRPNAPVYSQPAPSNPPPPPATPKGLTPGKSFKESIQDKASEVWARKGVAVTSTSPSKSCPEKTQTPAKRGTSPTKIHSPTKVSTGTKIVQQRLAEVTHDSSTSCSALAAQSRAARLAELEAIQGRWKNGVLKEDSSSSTVAKTDESSSRTADKETLPKQTSEQKTPGGKREESRNKAREEFNSKLAEIDMASDSLVTSEKKTPVRPPPPLMSSASKSTPCGSASSSHTGSIYSLIKKRDESKKETASVATDKMKQNNSFDDSDEETQQKIPRTAGLRAAKQNSQEKEVEFKKPEPPVVSVEDTDTDAASSSEVGDEEFGSSDKLPMEIDDDDISLKGFVSEATRRESILPPSMQRRANSHSSLDSYDDDDGKRGERRRNVAGPSSQAGGYQPDDDDSMYDDDDDRNAVDDLLDEAMDDSEEYDPDMDPRNVVMRRKPSETPSDDYDPDMDENNVVLRRKPQPVPAQRHQLNVNSTDDDEEDDRPYSLQAYRKSANVHLQMMEPVVRASRYAGRQVEEEEIEMPTSSRPQRDDRRLVQERIKELQELVQQEQNVIMQTSNALNKCCLGNSYFAGSAEQVECNRVLLIACQKRQCYMTEIQRLKDSGVLHPEGPGPQGSLTISDIRLPLKKEFVTKIGTSQDNTTHYFILLIRNNCQVICTQMLSTHDPMMRGSLDFPNLIKINGITGNFKLTLDIYSMSISKEFSKDKKKKTPKKGKGYAMSLESPGGPTAVRTTSFSHVTSLHLTMKCLDKSSFHLDRLPYLSPLYGQIFMRLKCLMESNVEERGFLTMFDDVSGFGAWHRRWCVLSGNKLCIWKYPDDETRKDPMFLIDLKRCITEKVGLVSRDVCARPNTFEMVTVRQPLKGEHDTLVTKTHNTMTTVRHQVSADSKEERIVWCNKLNRALANLRTWHADALKPVKQQPTSRR